MNIIIKNGFFNSDLVMFNSLDNQFSNQISTEFLDLIDIDFIQNNNDVNFTTRANSSEQEQQIASTPTTTEYYTFLPTEIYEIDENDNNNCRRFNPTNKKTHTFWPRENMYVENDNNESFYETNNIDLLERIKSIKKGLIGSLLFVSYLKKKLRSFFKTNNLIHFFKHF